MLNSEAVTRHVSSADNNIVRVVRADLRKYNTWIEQIPR